MLDFIKRILPRLIILVSIFSFCAFANASGKIWQIVGTADFSSDTMETIPIAISPSGTPYIAYQDGTNGNKANVMKYNGTTWVSVGAEDFSTGQAGDISLAIDATGTPYVAYFDAASSSRAMVQKYDGASWVTVGSADFSTSSISNTRLAFNPSGTPYLAFADAGHHITIMNFDGNDWVAVGDPYTSVLGAVPVLAFSTTGTPYVAFSNISTGQPTIISFNGTSWELVGSPIASVNLATNVSFAISSDNTLYVGTADIADYYLKMFTFNGSSWEQIGSTGTEVSSGDTNMAFSPSGTLYVAYKNTNTKSGVIKYNGSDWENVGDAQFSTIGITMTTLAFSPDGTAYIAYSDTEFNRAVVMAFLPTLPGQVTGLSGTAQSASAVRLSWTTPSDDGGSAITGYQIERSISGGNFSTITTVGSGVTSYTDTGLTSSATYTYRISAINNVGTGITSATANASTASLSGSGFTHVIPTALGAGITNNDSLSFSINAGIKITTSSVVNLTFNASPQTVRGYIVSLDPNFSDANSIVSYTENTKSGTISLPNVPGTYIVYLKYYSTTGIYSPAISQTIIYEGGNSLLPTTPTISDKKPTNGETNLFKRTLRLGSIGADVKALQQFLNSHGFLIAKQGPGSPGNETTKYGMATLKAVIAFQNANANIILKPNGLKKGTGVFGPSTIAVINEMK